jgi:hypothetical protein
MFLFTPVPCVILLHVYEKKVTFELMQIWEGETAWEHVALNYENVTFNEGKIGIVAFIRLVLLDFFLHLRPQIFLFFPLHLRPEGVVIIILINKRGL